MQIDNPVKRTSLRAAVVPNVIPMADRNDATGVSSGRPLPTYLAVPALSAAWSPSG